MEEIKLDNKDDFIYVVGHKNPDTDSIAAAIAYAELKKKIGYTNIRPARAGILNNQTSYILQRLNLRPPVMLGDLKARVNEIMTETPISVKNYEPINIALMNFEKSNIRYLPVIDDDNKPEGLLTLSIVTSNLLKFLSSDRISTSIKSISETLDANILCGGENQDEIAAFEILPTTSSLETFRKLLARNRSIPKIIVTDDRYDFQRIACRENVKIIILSNSCPVSNDIVKLAHKMKLTIISTNLNCSEILFGLKKSIPIKYIYSKEFKTIGYRRPLEEARIIMQRENVKGIMAVDDNGRLCGVITRSTFLRNSEKKVILVDHNEPAQALEGINEIEILEIVDHHRISTFQTFKPITFLNYPVGSTSTIVAMQYKNFGITPTKQIASLLLAGILSDTVILQSPTTTVSDKNMMKWLNMTAKIDARAFARDFFKAGSVFNIKNIDAIIKADFKTFIFNEKRIGISQFETVGMSEITKNKSKILNALNKIFIDEKLDFAGLLISDITIQSSLFFVITSEFYKTKIPWTEIENNIFDLKGILSRKKQVIPVLSRIF